MQEVLVAGAGKIGTLIATLLASTQDYHVHLADVNNKSNDFLSGDTSSNRIHHATLDVTHKSAFGEYIKQHSISTIISCLPYFCNIGVAEMAREYQLNYFDLTEDVEVTSAIKTLSQGAKTFFVPQCGLAPGFISIAANDLMRRFDSVDAVHMRVGALPVHPNNALKYALTWSTDGLINEYGNPCFGIVDSKEVILHPLEGLETIQIDGLLYEAFNTSGGLGSLADTYNGKVRTMNYKTLRYPGHCKSMRLLMDDLKLNEDRETLKKILEKAIPRTDQDVVLVYVSVNGKRKGEYIEETYVKKVYPKTIGGKLWSAIQVTTAASACAVMDIVLSQPTAFHELVLQESIRLDQFINNRFGQYYQ
jgi:saccharopine dehydrogenase-like NADP-dependent oxidoreductase